jgi:ATP-dependent RNA helicase DDX35
MIFFRVQKKRKDLRIIVSSATVDAEEFKDFFNSPTNWVNPSLKESVAILSIEGS